MKLSPMSDEVRAMIELRRSAEQRGHFTPMGRLLWMQTEHGTIQWPAKDGVASGPDVAMLAEETKPADRSLILLGPWLGLPILRINTTKPCPRCRHLCDACAGSGKKLCELCGGLGVRAGAFLPCPGAGCSAETGKFKLECSTCGGSGQIAEKVNCVMCRQDWKDAKGFTLMVCPKCRGSKKYSTGRKNGSVDWDGPRCVACDGTCVIGKWKPQPVKKFTNARLGKFLVLGPIQCFGLQNFESGRSTIFDVSQDSESDLTVLLVPARPGGPQKAYLVGGLIHERREMGARTA